jgi:AcrR family transcriptional regulator
MSPRPAIDHIRKPQILEAAAQVITERGLAATRIADVAKRAGTSPSAVVYWFGSREELLKAALIHDEETFAQDLGKRLATVEGAAARLRLLIEETVDDDDLSLWIELWSLSLHDPSAAEERRRLDRIWRELIASLISAGVNEGVFRPILDPPEAAVAVASLLDGLSVQATLGDEAVPADRLAAMALAQVSAIVGVSLEETPMPLAELEEAAA